jgi:hypothetical protein
MHDNDELPALPPVKKKKVKKKPAAESTETPTKETRSGLSTEERIGSYAIGGVLFLLGGGFLVWYSFLDRAPGKLFNLLAAGGVAAVLSGIGLFIQPLDGERMDAFQNEPNPIAVFKIMPAFWKCWLLVILAAMIGAFVYVAQTTERIA